MWNIWSTANSVSSKETFLSFFYIYFFTCVSVLLAYCIAPFAWLVHASDPMELELQIIIS